MSVAHHVTRPRNDPVVKALRERKVTHVDQTPHSLGRAQTSRAQCSGPTPEGVRRRLPPTKRSPRSQERSPVH
jgi:hypothetical protein